MIKISTFTLLIFCRNITFSQGPIKINKGSKFTQNGKKLMPRHLLEITKVNKEAFDLMKKAKSNYDGAAFLGAVGGFLVGFELGRMAFKPYHQASAGLLLAGGGLIIASIPLSSTYSKHAKIIIMA